MRSQTESVGKRIRAETTRGTDKPNRPALRILTNAMDTDLDIQITGQDE